MNDITYEDYEILERAANALMEGDRLSQSELFHEAALCKMQAKKSRARLAALEAENAKLRAVAALKALEEVTHEK